MTAIIIPRKHLIQPQGRVRVTPAWESRLASLLYFGDGQPRDIVDTAANYALSGSAVISPDENGLGMRAGTAMGYAESTGALSRFSGAFTLALYFNEIASTQGPNGGMMWAIPAASQYTQLAAGGGVYFHGQGAYTLSSNPMGTRNTSIVLRGAGADPAFFVGRGKATGVSASIATGSKTVRIGAWSSDGWQLIGSYGSVAVIAGAMSDDEAREHADYPWMFYAADPIRFYSLPSGGIPTSITVAASNITSSGARITATLSF